MRFDVVFACAYSILNNYPIISKFSLSLKLLRIIKYGSLLKECEVTGGACVRACT
jgi:hypothetical protein